MKPILLSALLIAVLAGCGTTGSDAPASGDPTVGGVNVSRDGKQLAVDLQGHVTAAGTTIWSKRRRVVVSPDGRWRAVVQLGPWGDEKTGTVAIGRRAPAAPLRIVERHLSGESPRIAWSPDSRWLALTVFTGRATSAVVVGTEGGRRVLARSFCGDIFSGFAWAPTGGDRLAISEGTSGTGCARFGLVLSVRGVDGSGGVVATGVKGVPSWSPDGRWIALSGQRTELLRPDGSQRQRVGGSGSATWSAHGGLLAVAGLDPDAIRVGTPGGTLSTWERGVGEGPDPSFSPDGRLLAYQRGSDLLIRRVADRSLVVRVPIADFVYVDNFTWSPGGRSLLFDASSD
jgi:hypothetical protein